MTDTKVIQMTDATQASTNLPAITPMSMIERAVERGADVALIEKLMDLKDRHDNALSRRAFDQAIAQAKAEIPPIRKNRTVDFTTQKGRTHYKHEDMAEVARTIDPILSKHGLSYRYRSKQDGGSLSVTCVLSHRDGYSEETTLCAQKDESGNKNHIQGVGSVATYLQRYTIKMALGLSASDEDDDGRGEAKPDRINADQFFTLQGLIEEAKADVPKLLKFIQATDIEELTVKQFDDAVKALRKKIASNAAGGE